MWLSSSLSRTGRSRSLRGSRSRRLHRSPDAASELRCLLWPRARPIDRSSQWWTRNRRLQLLVELSACCGGWGRPAGSQHEAFDHRLQHQAARLHRGIEATRSSSSNSIQGPGRHHRPIGAAPLPSSPQLAGRPGGPVRAGARHAAWWPAAACGLGRVMGCGLNVALTFGTARTHAHVGLLAARGGCGRPPFGMGTIQQRLGVLLEEGGSSRGLAGRARCILYDTRQRREAPPIHS